MKTASLWLLPACLVWGAGCESTPRSLPPQVISRLDYGTYPEDYETIIRSYFGQSIESPERLVYRFGQPYRAYLQAGPLMGGAAHETGYAVDVWLKYGSGPGASEPEHHLIVLMKNGLVILELREEDLGQIKRAP